MMPLLLEKLQPNGHIRDEKTGLRLRRASLAVFKSNGSAIKHGAAFKTFEGPDPFYFIFKTFPRGREKRKAADEEEEDSEDAVRSWQDSATNSRRKSKKQI